MFRLDEPALLRLRRSENEETEGEKYQQHGGSMSSLYEESTTEQRGANGKHARIVPNTLCLQLRDHGSAARGRLNVPPQYGRCVSFWGCNARGDCGQSELREMRVELPALTRRKELVDPISHCER